MRKRIKFSKIIHHNIIIFSICVLIFIVCGFLFAYFNVKIKSITVGNSSDSFEEVSWYLSNNGDYYLFLPNVLKRDNLFVNIDTNYKGVSISCYDINGKKIGKLMDSNYTDIFKYDDVLIKITKKNKISHQYMIHIIQSDIPSFFIKVDGGESSFNNILSDRTHKIGYKADSFIYGEKADSFNIKSIKGRGNSTWLRPKKPFQIKLYENKSLLNMKESNKWVLLTNHWDGSLSRNYLWYTLAKDLDMDYSVDCSPVDLYINNNYMGSYLLTNKVEVSSTSVDIGDNYLFEITNTFKYDIELKSGFRLNIKNIDFDRLNESDAYVARINVTNYLNDIENMIYSNDCSLEELSEYIDIESFIKYYWIQEISENYDVLRGSNYMYTKNGKLYMGPIWDMDDTLNRSYLYANTKENYILNNELLNNRISENWYIELYKKEGFSDMIDDFFVNNIEKFDNLVNILDDYKDKIKNSANMNYYRWSYEDMKSEQLRKWVDGDIDFESSISILKDNLIDRVNYYKNEYSLN